MMFTHSATSVGDCDIDYYHGRQKSHQLIYRLRRRTEEVDNVLRRYDDSRLQRILDVGTADGLMLAQLRQKWRRVRTWVGVDRSLDLLRAAPIEGVFKVQSDALALPFRDGSADAIIATAVIEHVDDPSRMVQECSRILRAGGLLILTTPDPTMERIATALGLLKETGHQHTFKLRELHSLCKQNGLGVLEARKFMFSPVGFPFERSIERLLERLGLGLIMANQLLVARRS